jgi:hypothetical protein
LGSTRRWREGLTDLTLRVDALTGEVRSPLKVNVIFQVPGHFLRPDFEGVRTGSFSRAASALIVQVALPEETPDDVEEYLRESLVAAVDEAERWAQRRGIAGDLGALRGILVQMEAAHSNDLARLRQRSRMSSDDAVACGGWLADRRRR